MAYTEDLLKHLIFDIDGTIWNTTGVVAGAWNKAVRASGIEELKDLNITDKMLQKEFGKPMDEIADDLFGDIDPVKKAELLENCCQFEHEAISENTEDLAYEGMRETMAELAKDNNLYIVSNCQDGYIELVIEKNGLKDIIKDYECFGHTGLLKADNIKLVMQRNHMDKAYYIGDTMGDYNSSKEAGAIFVFADYGFGEVPSPDYTIHSPSELLKIEKTF